MAIWWYSVEIYVLVVVLYLFFDFAHYLVAGEWLYVGGVAVFVMVNLFLILKVYRSNSTLARRLLALFMFASGVLIGWSGWNPLESLLARVYFVGFGAYLLIASIRLATLSQERIAEHRRTEEPIL